MIDLGRNFFTWSPSLLEWWIQTLPLNILVSLLRPVGTLLVRHGYEVNCAQTDVNA